MRFSLHVIVKMKDGNKNRPEWVMLWDSKEVLCLEILRNRQQGLFNWGQYSQLLSGHPSSSRVWKSRYNFCLLGLALKILRCFMNTFLRLENTRSLLHRFSPSWWDSRITFRTWGKGSYGYFHLSLFPLPNP